tara:strand:- start:10 stop:255 length:246 start_codon:yes stop_codon:yes gene_type:complete
MPTYNFINKDTGKEWEDTMSYKKLDEYYIEHNCEQVFHKMQQVVSGVKSLWSQTDDGFKDRMSEINKVAGRGGMSQTDYDK